jgi:hypothetical protein
VSPVKYEMGFYIPEDAILHSYRRDYLKSYNFTFIRFLHNIVIHLKGYRVLKKYYNPNKHGPDNLRCDRGRCLHCRNRVRATKGDIQIHHFKDNDANY